VRPHAAYTVVDLGALMAEHPERIRPMLAALLAGVGAGALRPLPTQTYPLAEVRAAFRTMAQGKHSGKLVITQEIADIPAAPRTNGRSGERASGVPPTRDDGTVLITGGLAGLGLYVGRWLVEQGVRHLVLVGRSSASSEAREAVAAMTAAGAEVRLAWADVARAEELARVLEDVTAHMPPLRGVIHSAGVLDDGVLLRQSWERFAAVMAPKVDGAWNLHVLTRGQPLDFFVLFSSAAALFGSAGQGNHAAANTFLDALAHYRRDHGLPALSINWGAWSEIGAAAERGVGERVEDQGIGTIAPDRGLELLERLLVADTAQVAVLPVDWPRYLDHRSTHGGVPAWLAGLARAATRRVDVAGRTPNGARREGTAVELARRLGGASPATRRAVLLDFVLEQAAAVLELGSAEALDPRQSLQSLGLDSLMAVELRNRLATGLPLSRPLPTTLVFDYPTVQALVDYLLAQLDGDGRTVTAAAASPGSPTDLLEAIATLSDEESERLLAEKMRSS
jgi:acyl carrier protein